MNDIINKVTLEPLEADDTEQFVKDNQYAFRYGATEEFGLRDDHFEEDNEIISRDTIISSINAPDAETYRIIHNGNKAGGAVISINKQLGRGELVLFYTLPDMHSRGIGYAAWLEIEKMHPEIKCWSTVTPYFEKRNIHFYVNKCGFHIVEYYNCYNPDPHDENEYSDYDFSGMFRFEKIIR